MSIRTIQTPFLKGDSVLKPSSARNSPGVVIAIRVTSSDINSIEVEVDWGDEVTIELSCLLILDTVQKKTAGFNSGEMSTKNYFDYAKH